MKPHHRLAAFVFLLCLLLPLGKPSYGEETPDFETYRNACLQGTTIYCIAIGMEEQKAGNDKQALEYYRLACRNHPGHLRACTPFLSLAREMGRLEKEAAPLEGQCQAGDDVLCFYLGKEYLKIAEYPAGRRHLERLCREDFVPPDADDYGPCYHLASSLQSTREYEQAQDIFRFDCERDRPSAKPSCDRYQTLTRQLTVNGSTAQEKPKPLEWREAPLLLLALLSVPSFFFWLWPGAWGLRFLRLPAPAIAFTAWLTWEFTPPGPPAPRTDLFFILPSLFLTLLLAGWAIRRLRAKRVNEL